jgi:BirA family biotin operon repressor/biotin-[acetyl-CoA-carboxylase] ligase
LSTITKFKRNWLLIGVGINVNNDVPAGLEKTATSIKQVRGQTQGRSRLIEAILHNIWTAWQDFDKTGFGPYQQAVGERLTGVGKLAKVAMGKKSTQGTLMGIDPQGGLLLKSKSSTETVHAGEIVGTLS